MLDPTLLDRIRAEFREMPGLRLSAEQTGRLCGAGREACREALDLLVASGFLIVRSDGFYGRVTGGPEIPRPRPIKVHPEPRTTLKHVG